MQVDDVHYVSSFTRLRANLSAWCISCASSLTPEFRNLPSTAVPLFPLTLRQLSHSEILPLYRENSAFRLAVLQAFISRYLADVVFARACNVEVLDTFISILRGFMSREVDFTMLQERVMQPAMLMADNIADSGHRFAVVFFAVGTCFDPAIHNAALEVEAIDTDNFFICLFPALLRDGEELLVLSRATVSLMTEWTNNDLGFWPVLSPHAAIHSQLQSSVVGLSSIDDDTRSQLISREKLYLDSISDGDKVISHWWRIWAIAMGLLSLLLVVALAVSLPLVTDRAHEFSKSSSLLIDGQQLELTSVLLTYTNSTKFFNDLGISTDVTYDIGESGIATLVS